MSFRSDKEDRFVREYLVDLNATQAAIRAGYSVRRSRQTGSQLLNRNAKEIQEEMDRRAKRVKVDPEYVLRTIVETIERCQQARPVLDKKGNPVVVETPLGEMAPAFVFDSSAVLKGCELLGKHLKLFTDKIELSGNVGLAERIKAARERTK